MRTSRGTGLGLPGVVAVTLGPGLAGALYDVLTGPALGAAFRVAFVVGCLLAALLVRRDHLGAAVVVPPLSYLVVAAVVGTLQGTSSTGSVLVRQALTLFTALVLQAPALLLGTALAAVVVLVRRVTTRRPTPVDATGSQPPYV